jgi:hypothetical protein
MALEIISSTDRNSFKFYVELFLVHYLAASVVHIFCHILQLWRIVNTNKSYGLITFLSSTEQLSI